MKRVNVRSAVIFGSAFSLAFAAFACGDDDTNNNTPTTTNNNTGGGGDNNNTGGGGDNNNTNNNTGPTACTNQPAGTVPIGFTIDDSANQTYGADDGLIWKGSYELLSEDTLEIEQNTSWPGPFAPVYDDGPCDAATNPGHEPPGATAGDNIWGVVTFLAQPTEDVPFEYGAENADGWIWRGPNGTFTVAANAETDKVISATGLVIEAFGDIDMRLLVDSSSVTDEGFDPANGINVKSSAWAWAEIPLADDGATNGDEVANDGTYTFTLDMSVGAGTDFRHTGLLKVGDQAQFVLVVSGVEYKGEVDGISGTVPLTGGVRAQIRRPNGDWEDIDIQYLPDGDQNTFIEPTAN